MHSAKQPLYIFRKDSCTQKHAAGNHEFSFRHKPKKDIPITCGMFLYLLILNFL